MLSRATSTPNATRARLEEVIRALAGPPGKALTWAEQCRLELERCELVEQLVAHHAFATPDYLARSEQWRRAAAVLRRAAPCPLLLDWLLLQVEVAQNLERGMSDMRPRRTGPCHALALAHARDRRRKAEAVLEWARSATI